MKTSKRPFSSMMKTAMRLVSGRDVQAATRVIQKAVRTAVRASTQATKFQGDVIDVIMREKPSPARRPPLRPKPTAKPTPTPRPTVRPRPAARAKADMADGRQRAEGLGRDYKLFVPPKQGGSPRPLIVMLHGCTQDADDFAVGTGMNELAAANGFFVLYPEQSKGANSSQCWNWFKHNHQARGAGEPAVIAGMVQTVMKEHAVDPSRVYVAGLSAGGAMAAILGDAYPDVFAAVGVHSGLPTGAANDAGSAFAAMQTGGQGGLTSVLNPSRAAPVAERTRRSPPTIVFHGDADYTVNPVNGDQVLAASLADAEHVATLADTRRQQANGREVTKKVFRDADGRAQAEQWTVHGAGHAWFGGNKAGSYTDARGPDASREMMRFFFEHPLGKAGASDLA